MALPRSEDLCVSDLVKMQLPERSLNCLCGVRLCNVFSGPSEVKYTIPTIFHALMVHTRQKFHRANGQIVFRQLGLECIPIGHGSRQITVVENIMP